MITCKNCGATAPDESIFCPKCGTKLEVATAETEPEVPAAAEEVSAENVSKSLTEKLKPNPADKKTFVPLVLAACFLISVICFASAKSKTANIQKELDVAKQEISELQKEKDKIKREADDAELSKDIISEIGDFLSRPKGRSYNDNKQYYADRPVLILRKGDTEVLNVHVSFIGTIDFDNEDSSVVSCEWAGTEYRPGVDTPVNVTGLKVGTSEITFKKEGTDARFTVLAVVIP